MNKQFIIVAALAAFLVVAGPDAAAVSGPGSAQMEDGTGAQVQNQTQVQNQGETTQVQTREQEAAMVGVGAGAVLAEQRRSRVANAVQAMLQVAERNDGIGAQVRTIAQTQTQNQEKLEAGLQKLVGRSSFVKFLIGPDYGEIKAAARLLEKNRDQIRLIEQFKDQVADQADLQELESQLEVLTQVNSEIEYAVGSAEKGFSLLGWMFRLFAK